MPSTSPKGPSYASAVKELEDTVARLQEKAVSIQRRFVPTGMLRPKEESEKIGDDSVFGDLVRTLSELRELDDTLSSIIECF